MQNLAKKYRHILEPALDSILRNQEEELKKINPWGEVVLQRYRELVCGGKMIRGSLVLAAYQLVQEDLPPQAISTAAALELLHTSVLVHDDIIDRDEIRRNQPTLYAHFRNTGEKENLADPHHFGLSMAVCAGDLGFFLTYQILQQMDAPSKIRDKISAQFYREFLAVGLAHMEDIYLGQSSRPVREHQIMELYRLKTARYTFSLPFALGGILAGMAPSTIEDLEKLGEALGLIFQIKDDEIGLFGDQKDIGKPVGSDVREGKKTLFYHFLLENTSREEKEKLGKIYGQNSPSQEELEWIKSLLIARNIPNLVEEKVEALVIESQKIIFSLPLEKEKKNLFYQMLNYNLERVR